MSTVNARSAVVGSIFVPTDSDEIRRLITNLQECVLAALEIPFVPEAPSARHITP